MTTPLPEQGGFNERLDGIIAKRDEFILSQGVNGFTQEECRDAIRTLVLEEIVEHDPANRFNCEALRAEQRMKLGDTNGTK